MTATELQQLKDLAQQMRTQGKTQYSTAEDPQYDCGYENALNSAADQLEEVLESLKEKEFVPLPIPKETTEALFAAIDALPIQKMCGSWQDADGFVTCSCSKGHPSLHSDGEACLVKAPV